VIDMIEERNFLKEFDLKNTGINGFNRNIFN